MKPNAKRPSSGTRVPRAEAGPRRSRTDLLLKGGVGMAALAAALFPWYVFFNEDKFGVSVAGWEGLRDVRGFRQRDVVEVPPMSVSRKSDLPPVDPTDMLSTATVPAAGPGDVDGDAGILQPFPGRPGFRLLHVANGRAMIEDGNGIYVVQAGSILPDNSRLAALTQKDGKWVIITSTGEVHESAE